MRINIGGICVFMLLVVSVVALFVSPAGTRGWLVVGMAAGSSVVLAMWVTIKADKDAAEYEYPSDPDYALKQYERTRRMYHDIKLQQMNGSQRSMDEVFTDQRRMDAEYAARKVNDTKEQ